MSNLVELDFVAPHLHYSLENFSGLQNNSYGEFIYCENNLSINNKTFIDSPLCFEDFPYSYYGVAPLMNFDESIINHDLIQIHNYKEFFGTQERIYKLAQDLSKTISQNSEDTISFRLKLYSDLCLLNYNNYFYKDGFLTNDFIFLERIILGNLRSIARSRTYCENLFYGPQVSLRQEDNLIIDMEGFRL